jgi:hypothetical protein
MTHNRPEVTQQDIEKRAYEIYLLRGGMEGADLEDWLIAERELLGAQEQSGGTIGEEMPGHTRTPSTTESVMHKDAERATEGKHKTATASDRSSR